jgi:xanthine/uracil permease
MGSFSLLVPTIRTLFFCFLGACVPHVLIYFSMTFAIVSLMTLVLHQLDALRLAFPCQYDPSTLTNHNKHSYIVTSPHLIYLFIYTAHPPIIVAI